MSPLTLILLAAAALDHVEAERAAERIQRARYCAAVERRAQHREVDRVQPLATADVKSARGFSDEERDQIAPGPRAAGALRDRQAGV